MKLAVLCCLSLASVLAADLPQGESLINRCIASEGGAQAIQRSQTAIRTCTVAITGRNITGPLEIFQQGDKSSSDINLPGIGKVEEGFDGEVKILASCPSSLQGLSRFEGDTGMEADYIVIEMARNILGEGWMESYVKEANAGGIERVLV